MKAKLNQAKEIATVWFFFGLIVGYGLGLVIAFLFGGALIWDWT